MPATERGPVPQSTRDVEFAEFFRATWPRLFRTTYAVAGDRLLAEDSLQAAFAIRRPWFRAERSSDVLEPEPLPSADNRTVDRDAVWRAVCSLRRVSGPSWCSVTTRIRRRGAGLRW